MIDDILPFISASYSQLGFELAMEAIEQKNIIDFFPTPQMKLAFTERFEKDQAYLKNPQNENSFRPNFNYDFGYGEIHPCYLINLPGILPAYRNKLIQNNKILEEKFEQTELIITATAINYKSISCNQVIFCDGIASFQNPYFRNLPFAPNKGEVLWIEAPGLPHSHIFKKGLNLVPWSQDIFWVGSSYEWEFENDEPSFTFRERTTSLLTHWLKLPFKVIDHKASVRPATLERRPFVGFHPLYQNIGILNGMGTKGCSLAPYFAEQLVQCILHQIPVHPEADIKRFNRVLNRS